MPLEVTNILIGGLGGQGVLKASDILAEAALEAGFDVKKSELHGMSQRGGSVRSDVRFGRAVFSPMIPHAEADFLLVLAPDQIETHRDQLRPGGVLVVPGDFPADQLANRKSLNVALLGVLSRHLPFPEECWLAALHANLKPALWEGNWRTFRAGRAQPETEAAS